MTMEDMLVYQKSVNDSQCSNDAHGHSGWINDDCGLTFDD